MPYSRSQGIYLRVGGLTPLYRQCSTVHVTADSGYGEALRLVKLRLPANLVRAMDEHIVGSRGAYIDRNEFVAEAVWDRLNEDAAHGGTSGTTDSLASRTAATDSAADLAAPGKPPLGDAGASEATGDEWVADPFAFLGEIGRRVVVPTLPRRRAEDTIFGLHNRDLPTLWSAAHLARMAATEGGPVPWASFTTRLRAEAQRLGAYLRDVDQRGGVAVKASVGFPKSGEKARSSEDRFITTAVGAPTRTGLAGPALLLGLVAPEDGQEARPAIAPTPEALGLLGDLVDAGFGIALPQPEIAARRWLVHVATCAPAEYAAWLQVLEAIADKPTRGELLTRFPLWRGTTADTNTAGYVSRGREWGLVVPDLSDGRYRLTPLGERIVVEGNAR